jgi:hypothetical protein
MKTRKRYMLRHHENNGRYHGKTVGHKARLLPRHVAARIAKRLRKFGLFTTIDAMHVNVTAEQAAYLGRRYS